MLLFDREEGWRVYQPCINAAIHSLAPASSVQWGGTMDLTQPLSDDSNAQVRAVASDLDVILVVAACDVLGTPYTRIPNTVFFETLLTELKLGAFLLFVEPVCNAPYVVGELAVGNKRLVRADSHCTTGVEGLQGIKLLQVSCYKDV
jgi:hypothetical protein